MVCYLYDVFTCMTYYLYGVLPYCLYDEFTCMMYYLEAQQVVNGADDDVDSARVSRLCSQVVLKICC